MNDTLIATEKLANGLKLSFLNQGNRYFGNFHQVKVIVSGRIELSDKLVSDFLSKEDLIMARQIFGDHVEYSRLLKQMGVPGEDVEKIEHGLINSFRENAMSYMHSEDFPSRFVARRLAVHRSRSPMHLMTDD